MKLTIYRADQNSPINSIHNMEIEYWCRVFTEMENRVDDNLHFIFTDSQDSLPQRDKNTVVVLASNEQYRIPTYHQDVLAVFTNYVKSDCVAGNIFPVPHGIMYRLPRLPYKPMMDRPIDVCFCGWLHGRRQEVLQNIYSRLNGKCNVFMQQHNSATMPPHLYGIDILWNSKIVLDLFGGHGPETFRYYESLLYGCATISQKKPDHWVYKDSPAIFLDSWFDYDLICNKILDLLSHPDELEQLGKKSRRFFFERYNEPVVASYICQKLLCIKNQS